jgi:quinol monooxygenase YgiN
MVTVLAKLVAKDGQDDQLKLLLEGLLQPTRKEQGCVQYDLHQDVANPETFYFYEIWESSDDLKKHGESSHIQTMRRQASDFLLSTELNFLNKL